MNNFGNKFKKVFSLCLILLLLSTLSLMAQVIDTNHNKEVSVKNSSKNNSLRLQEKQSYGITIKENERINFYHKGSNPIRNEGNFTYCPTEKNEFVKYTWPSNYKLIVHNNRLHYRLEIKEGKTKLLEIIAFNDKYVLAGIWGAESVLKCFVYNRDFKLIESNIETKKGDTSILKILDLYFNDCDILRSNIELNIKYFRNVSNGFTYYNCGNSTDLMKW